MKTIAIDLDGTILLDDYSGMRTFGDVDDRIVDSMRRAKSAGWAIVIHTCRLNPQVYDGIMKTPEACSLVHDFLVQNNIPFDAIWVGIGKPIANFYVDDRAISPDGFAAMEW